MNLVKISDLPTKPFSQIKDTGVVPVSVPGDETYKVTIEEFEAEREVGLATKMDKISTATEGNFVAFSDEGNAVDSGKTSSSFASVTHSHVLADETTGVLPVNRIQPSATANSVLRVGAANTSPSYMIVAGENSLRNAMGLGTESGPLAVSSGGIGRSDMPNVVVQLNRYANATGDALIPQTGNKDIAVRGILGEILPGTVNREVGAGGGTGKDRLVSSTPTGDDGLFTINDSILTINV